MGLFLIHFQLHGRINSREQPFYRGWTAASRTRVDSMPSRAVSRLSLEIFVTSTTSVPRLIWMGFWGGGGSCFKRFHGVIFSSSSLPIDLWWPQKCLLLELKEAWLIINPSANVPESWQWLMRHAQECVCDAEEFLVPHWLLQSALRGVAQGSEMFGKRFGGRVGKRVFQPGELMILCSPQFPPVLKSSGLCFQRESHMVRYHI